MAEGMVGTYECKASNGYGEVTKAVTIGMVSEPPPRPTVFPDVGSETIYVGGRCKRFLLH